jgi:exodeoxyribonuclease V alpha subunit
MGVERADEQSRQTTLSQKLQEMIAVKALDEELTVDDTSLSAEELLMQVNPMIGMENVTPYDFMVND